MERFDAFLSYNTEDRLDLIELNAILQGEFAFRTWFDEDQILPGESFISKLEEGIQAARACAVFVGQSGLGPWEKREVYAALSSQVQRPDFRVIPVLLPSAQKQPTLPLFLKDNRWVDLRGNYFAGLRQLIIAIRGNAPALLARAPLVFPTGYSNVRDALPSAFSTDVESVVNLLIGESLYSRKDVFVRELVQNAVDACERSKQEVLSYIPQIVIRINNSEGWFEVDDNGEGMSPTLLRERFAIIGRSIRDEESVLLRTATSQKDRLFLIAKFGIGFITTFLVAKRVEISTRYENAAPIHIGIAGIRSPFIYRERSVVDRDPLRLGTTIRVYLREEFHRGGVHAIDLANVVNSYVRHCNYVGVILDGNTLHRGEDWGTTDCIFSKQTRVTQRFEARIGVSKNTGKFIASNAGFLVCENPEPILPASLPVWMVGEINFWPGAVDLNIARNAVVQNEKSEDARQALRSACESVLLEFVRNRIQEVSRDPKEHLSPHDDRVRKLLLYYCSSSRENPLLSEHLATELFTKLVYTPFGPDQRLHSVHECLQTIEINKIGVAYTYFRHNVHPAMSVIVEWLRATGNLVLQYSAADVPIYGHKGGLAQFSERESYKRLLAKRQVKLVTLDDTPPEMIKGLAVDPASLPEFLRRETAALSVKGKLVFIRVPGGDLTFSVTDTLYLNVENPKFQQFTRALKTLTPELLRAYLLGVTQRDIREITRSLG